MKRKTLKLISIVFIALAVVLTVSLNYSYALWISTEGSFSDSKNSSASFGLGSWKQKSAEDKLDTVPVIDPNSNQQLDSLIHVGYFTPRDYNYVFNAWYSVKPGFIFSRIVNGTKTYYSVTYELDFGKLSNRYDAQAFKLLNFQIEYDEYARLEGNRIYLYKGEVYLRITDSDSWIVAPQVKQTDSAYKYYAESNLVYSSTKTYQQYEPVRYNGRLYQVTNAALANKSAPDSFNQGWKCVDDPQWKASNTYLNNDMVLVGEKIYKVLDNTRANLNSPGTVNSGWKRIDSIYWVGNNNYNSGEVVIVAGQYYKSKTSNNNSVVTDTGAWEKINYRVWDSEVTYQIGDILYYGKNRYVSLVSNNTSSPEDASKWTLKYD